MKRRGGWTSWVTVGFIRVVLCVVPLRAEQLRAAEEKCFISAVCETLPVNF